MDPQTGQSNGTSGRRLDSLRYIRRLDSLTVHRAEVTKMHEMALAEGVLQVVLEAAQNQKVRRVRLQVGRLQAVVPESLEFSFQLAASDTPAADAVIELEEIPARLHCRLCGAMSEIDLPPFNCRHCGASDIEIISGDEMLVDAVELENGQTIRRRAVAASEILEEHLKEHAAHDAHHR